MSKHLELAKKLAALAKQGIGGEAVNAQKMLERIMLEHKITMEDIEGEQVKLRWFRFERRFERLFKQLVAKVVGSDSTTWQRKGNRDRNIKETERAVECTVAQYVEMEWMLKVYCAAWDEEIAILHRAFAVKHKLFDPNKTPKNYEDCTPEEQEEFDRANRMARNLKERQYQKQIEG